MNRLLFIILVMFALQVQGKHQTLSLKKALELNVVKASAISLGGHADYCMKMNLKNLINDSLIVIVEAGRRLNSLDDKNQDILITKEEIIVLMKHEDKWFKVKGYCCQASNHSPPVNSKYAVNTLADSNLVRLANYLNKNSFDQNVEQQAIWAISDLRPTAQITAKNDSLLVPLRQLVANLKGEPLPWYTVISATHVFTSGIMETYPLWLRGKLEYAIDKDCYTTLHIMDAKGAEVCQIIRQWALAGGDKKFDLNIPLKGLAKGKYTIELNTPDKQLVKKEFEI
jgi:hypothetical protein